MGMFDFLGDFGEGATGQRQIPQLQQLSPQQLMAGMGASVGPLADMNIEWNNRLGPAYAGLANRVEDIYNPRQRELRGSTTKSILDELNLGGNISREDSDRIKQSALQGNVASGFGMSSGGRGGLARDLGLQSLKLKNERMDRARGFLSENPKGYQLYHPQTFADPSDVANQMIGNNNAFNAHSTFSSLLDSQNKKNEAGSLLDAVGSIFGGAGGIGGSGGGGIDAILKGAGGIMNFNGSTPSSVPAQQLDLGWGADGGNNKYDFSAGGANVSEIGKSLAMGGGGGGGDMFGGSFLSGIGGAGGPMSYASIPGAVYQDANAIDQGNYGAGFGGLAGTALGGYYGMPGLGQSVGSTFGGVAQNLIESWFS